MDSPIRRRIGSVGIPLAIVIAALVGRPATATGSEMPLSRVRSTDPSITALLQRALPHSPTLRRLVATIEASDGIVYMESGQCPGRVAACLPYWMMSSAGNRFVRVVFDRKRLDSNRDLLAAIGHELQHVIEVLEERSITSGLMMLQFYQRHAPTTQDQFETRRATNAGLAVRKELNRTRAARDCMREPAATTPVE